MHNHESAMADFYDHEVESPPEGRREAPDWGGDDLFTTTPRRRRFDRPLRGEHPSEPSDRFDRARRRDTMEHPVQRPLARRAADQAELGDLEELVVDFAGPAVAEMDRLDAGAPHLEPTTEPARAGRRTVTVTGHPDGSALRRRPAPSLDERFVGSRP